MVDLKWSESEKKIARRVFEAALKAELAEVMAEFKARAVAATEPDDMWSIEESLRSRRYEIDKKYDYRYSQLLVVFGRLLHERRIQETQLAGLSEEKLLYIRRIASVGRDLESPNRVADAVSAYQIDPQTGLGVFRSGSHDVAELLYASQS
jgi:hypothetical protein